MSISILKTTKDYIVLKIPREIVKSVGFFEQNLTELEALKILRSGIKEYKLGKTKSIKTFIPTAAEKKALVRGRHNFAKGNYITLKRLKYELGINN